jgi:predicted transposase YbfD/YdcC
VARVDQKTSGRKKETVWLLTSRTETQLSASLWLTSRRTYWGIENGLHQRLDASAGDDACRVRTPNAVWILGMFRRLAVSLFIEWRSRDATRKWCTMTDFYADMRKNNQRRGFLLVTSKECRLAGKNE